MTGRRNCVGGSTLAVSIPAQVLFLTLVICFSVFRGLPGSQGRREVPQERARVHAQVQPERQERRHLSLQHPRQNQMQEEISLM